MTSLIELKYNFNNPSGTFLSVIKEDNVTFFIPHKHDYIELYYVLSGQGIETLNSTTYELKPGTLVLILPFQIHQLFVSEQDHLSIIKIAFSLDSIYNTNGFGHDLYDLIFSDQPSVMHIDSTLIEHFTYLFTTLLEEQLQPFLWKEKMLQAKLTELLISFDRYRTQNTSQPPIKTRLSKKQTIWDIVYFIHSHSHESLTLDILSSHFHLNKTYISGAFSKHFGQSFVSFLTEVRLRNACSLLLSTTLPITEIAYQCGFPTYNSFSRIFVKEKGISPSCFRQKKSKLSTS